MRPTAPQQFACRAALVAVSLTLCWCGASRAASNGAAAEPLHRRIDAMIAAKLGGEAAPPATDAEFLRRVYLDLAGTIPTADEARAFLADVAPDKRAKLVDRLLAAPTFPRRMQEAFTVMLLERRTGTMVPPAEWEQYLWTSFEQGKPLDQLFREILAADGTDDATLPAMRFFLDRPVTDHAALARDVGRLMLGVDLACAQCHDHPTIADYKQADFQGLLAFLNRSTVYRPPAPKDPKAAAAAKASPQPVFFIDKGDGQGKVEFESVFKMGVKHQTGPRLPGGKEFDVPTFEKNQALAQPAADGRPPVAKFRPRQTLAAELPTAANAMFRRNLANRLWFLMMGRGLVHPLDLSHGENPPSHPELLELLSNELATSMKFDARAFLREVALSEAYARSSVRPDGAAEAPPERYQVANLKRLSAEQLLWSVLTAAGERDALVAASEGGKPPAPVAAEDDTEDTAEPKPVNMTGPVTLDLARKKFVAAFANPPGEAEVEFAPSAAAALFVSNDPMILDWLKPRPGNLVDRLAKVDDPTRLADELYLSVLTRVPDDEERAEVAAYLTKRGDARADAIGELAWSLLASTEFGVNH